MGGDYAIRVVLLGLFRASGRLVVGRAASAAALRGGASPVRVCRAMPRVTGYGNWRKGRRGLECSSPRAWVVGLRSEDDRRRGRAAVTGGARGERCCGAPPGLWVARVDAWRHCEAGRGVSGIRRATAARKRGGRVFTGGEVVGEIRRVQGRRSRKEASVMLLESRRGFCSAPMGLRCGGAA